MYVCVKKQVFMMRLIRLFLVFVPITRTVLHMYMPYDCVVDMFYVLHKMYLVKDFVYQCHS